jgi:hypothetical protein
MHVFPSFDLRTGFGCQCCTRAIIGMLTTNPNAWISWARCPVSGAALRVIFVGVDVLMLASRKVVKGSGIQVDSTADHRLRKLAEFLSPVGQAATVAKKASISATSRGLRWSSAAPATPRTWPGRRAPAIANRPRPKADRRNQQV